MASLSLRWSSFLLSRAREAWDRRALKRFFRMWDRANGEMEKELGEFAHQSLQGMLRSDTPPTVAIIWLLNRSVSLTGSNYPTYPSLSVLTILHPVMETRVVEAYELRVSEDVWGETSVFLGGGIVSGNPVGLSRVAKVISCMQARTVSVTNKDVVSLMVGSLVSDEEAFNSVGELPPKYHWEFRCSGREILKRAGLDLTRRKR